MDFGKLYCLGDACIRGALHVRLERELCGDEDRALLRGELKVSEPLVCRQFMGGKPRDLIGMTWAGLYLFSERVLDVLRAHHFTGWTTYPVELYGKDKARIEGYHGFAVTGRCGPIDHTKSTPRICEPPVPRGRRARMWFGLCFDEKTWDGSDIFIPERTKMIVVVEAVKVALEKAKLTNIAFEPLSECQNQKIPAEFL